MRRIIIKLSKLFDKVSGWTLLATMILLVVNILTRRIFNQPITVTYEVVGFLILITNCLAIANCEVEDGYVSMDMLLQLFSHRVQKMISIVLNTLVIIVLSATSWEMVRIALNARAGGEHADITGLPLYPLIFLLSICFFFLTLVLITKYKSVPDKKEA